jgi:2-keto-3-deoxy-L-arabinonate dehydratase
MKNVAPFRGMMPIMPTAITESCELDEASQRRVVRYCLDCRAAAIGHFGFASEFHKVSDHQRRRLIEIIVDEVAGRVPVFIGVTSPAVHISAQYAKEAEALGADLIMATLPYVNIPGPEGAFTYYAALSDATSLPIIVQDASHSSSVLSADLLLRMFDEIEHVRYVKAEGTKFLAKTATLIEGSGGRFPVIGGAAGKHLIHMLRLGVTAFMTGTEALELHASAVQAFLEGDEQEAARLYYEKVLPYLLFYMDYSAELLKEMLHRRGVLACPKEIPPAEVAPMSDVERREFEWILNRIGLYQQPDVPQRVTPKADLP